MDATSGKDMTYKKSYQLSKCMSLAYTIIEEFAHAKKNIYVYMTSYHKGTHLSLQASE